MTGWMRPVTLTRPEARLEPLSQQHAADLAEATADGDLHRLWYTFVPSADGMAREIDSRLSLQATRRTCAGSWSDLGPSDRFPRWESSARREPEPASEMLHLHALARGELAPGLDPRLDHLGRLLRVVDVFLTSP